MLCAQPLEMLLARRGEREANHAMITRVGAAMDEAGLLGSIDQPNHAVVALHEVVGDVPDRRPAWIRVPAHGKQQLMLLRRDASGFGLLFAPLKEAA